MDSNLFRYIWRHTRRDQIWIIAVIVVSLPFLFLALDLPKQIVNGPIQGRGFPDAWSTQRLLALSLTWPSWFPASMAGQPWVITPGVELARMPMLVALSLLFLGLVCINGLFKFYINTFKGRLGERMLRRLRYELVDRLLRFPMAHARRMKSAEVATMVKDEIEPLGGFIGDAFVQPVFLLAQALTALVFILVQNVWLGAIAGAIVLAQAIFIPRLRRRLLELGKEQQLTARDLAGRVAEVVDGLAEVRTNDASTYERADIAQRLGRIYFIRYELFERKFFIKFLNNFLAQVTPFLFFLLGGALAIKGRMDIGQLVAVIAAYKDLPGPIKELIDWDQQRQDVQIKYTQVAEQFSPDTLVPAHLQSPEPGQVPRLLRSKLEISGLAVTDDSGSKILDHADLTINRGDSIAAIGDNTSPGALAEALARLVPVAAGRIRLDGRPLDDLPEAQTGRRIAYVGADTFLRNTSLRDSLMFGLMNFPVQPDSGLMPHARREALAAGNSTLNPDTGWVDYHRIGAADQDELNRRLLRLLALVELEDDVFEFGLRSARSWDLTLNHDVTSRLLDARTRLRSDLKAEGLAHLVEPLDPARYHSQTTVGDNLVFGAALDERFRSDHLASNSFVLAALKRNGLDARLFDIGRRIAATVMELFAGLPSDHPFFERLSFVRADELPLYQAVLARIGTKPMWQAAAGDRSRMLALAFGYIEPRHRLGLLDEQTQQLIVAARQHIHDDIPRELLGSIAFYEPDGYNHASTLEHNILFGRVTQGVADAAVRVRRVMRQTLDNLDLRHVVLDAGLDFMVGPGGRRLSQSQRQKVGLARALLKQPDLLIVNRGLNALSSRSQQTIMRQITAATHAKAAAESQQHAPPQATGAKRQHRHLNGLTGSAPAPTQVPSADPQTELAAGAVFWVLANPALDQAQAFDRIVVFEDGRLVEDQRAPAVTSTASARKSQSKALKFLGQTG
jgi:putative ABC transport system ATP-binding protein